MSKVSFEVAALGASSIIAMDPHIKVHRNQLIHGREADTPMAQRVWTVDED